MNQVHVALVSSQGGHSGQIKLIFTKQLLKDTHTIFVTEEPGTNYRLAEKSFLNTFPTYYFKKDSLGFNPLKYIKRFFQLRSLFIRENIQLLITNGAQLSIPAVMAAKLLGIRVIFLDTFIRVKSPNWSARFCYYFSDRFLVQHTEMMQKYGKKSQFEGSVL